MNKTVVKKLVQAKLLEYEALKEILATRLPEPMKEKAQQVESDLMGIAKEIAWEQLMGRGNAQEDTKEDQVSSASQTKYSDGSNEEAEDEEQVRKNRGESGSSCNRTKGNVKSKTHHINICFEGEE